MKLLLTAALAAILTVLPRVSMAQVPQPDGGDPPTAAADPQDHRDAAPQDPSRIFGVMPNFTTVENGGAVTPIDAQAKFKMASLNTFDPFVYPFVGVVALLNRSYGSGTRGYVKQYAASLTDNVAGNFMTTAVLPSLLHQDPRYFERGSGGFLHRLAYAASRTAITKGDSGRAQFNVSEVGGTAIAAGVSNLYYPAAQRTVGATLERSGLQVSFDALANELKEFWPDIRQMLH